MLISNIATVYGLSDNNLRYRRGREISQIGYAGNVWLRVEGDRFADWGPMSEFPETDGSEEIVDAAGGFVIPSFCDSHSHIVYAGNRAGEFEDKIRGLSYEEIARRGGGILNSADLLAETSEDELYRQSMVRVREVMSMGTGCLEIKSGYGLTLESELKMLRVIARIAESVPMKVKSTFLGAHAVGRAYAGRQAEYVDHVIEEMIPAVAAEGLADFVDVFADRGFFTNDEAARIMEAGLRHGLRAKIHADELDGNGPLRQAIDLGAASVDHLERITPEEVALLAEGQTVATGLPGASFFLGMPYAPVRQLIENDAIVALASDYNPGSSPSGNMRMVMSLGCIKMKLTPTEALNAVTINGAAAMGCSEQYGSIAPGKVANFIITKPMSSLAFLPYAYATPLIAATYLRGQRLD